MSFVENLNVELLVLHECRVLTRGSKKKIKNNKVDLISNNDPLDKNRVLVEDLWESVLREELSLIHI